MVNCKNCGAPLSLDNAYCPHCGTANPEAKEHLEKLAKLDLDYKKTKFDVISEVKKNKSGYGVLTILVVILLCNLLLIPAHASSYRIADRLISNRKSVDEVKELLNNYLIEKDYERFCITYDKYAIDYQKYNDYNRIYYLADSFLRVKEQIINHFYGVDLYADALIRACQNIKEYKDDYDRYKVNQENNAILNDLNIEFNLFVETFLKLSEEEIDNVSNMSESELLVLVSKRLTNEEE